MHFTTLLTFSRLLFFTDPTELQGRSSPGTLLWGFLLQIRLFNKDGAFCYIHIDDHHQSWPASLHMWLTISSRIQPCPSGPIPCWGPSVGRGVLVLQGSTWQKERWNCSPGGWCQPRRKKPLKTDWYKPVEPCQIGICLTRKSSSAWWKPWEALWGRWCVYCRQPTSTSVWQISCVLLKDCCWISKDAGVLGLQRRRIQSRARDEAGSLRAFV